MLIRLLSSKLLQAKKSILLLGPRQTGKSTLIRNLDPDLIINLANENTFLEFLSDPNLLNLKINKEIKNIFIDEVQRLPSILNTIQAIIDDNQQIKFYLTGSSARKLKRGKANLLPGRILSFELGPLTLSELTTHFDLKKALSIGLLPGIYSEPDIELSKKILRSYTITYLKEEIQAEALTKNLEGFSRFLNIVSSRSGSLVDFSKYASQAMIERTSAKRYFDILIDTLIVKEVESFTKSKKKRLVQHSKFYFFDTGVLNSLQGSFDISTDRIGMLFEHLVLQIICSEFKSRDIDYKISFYRTEKNVEVDFIIEFSDQLIALEVKATKKIGQHDLKGLNDFSDFYKKPHRSIIIYLGDSVLKINDTIAINYGKINEVIFEENQ